MVRRILCNPFRGKAGRLASLLIAASRRRSHLGRSGATALEFAIVSLAFFTMVLGAMEVGYDFFIQAALDTGVQNAARAVQVGNARFATGEQLSTFMQQSICPTLGRLLNCGNLYVSIIAVPAGDNYGTYLFSNPINLAAVTASTNVVNTGTAGQLMLVRAFYLSPTFLGALVPGFSVPSPFNDTQRVHVSFASAGFVNEYF